MKGYPTSYGYIGKVGSRLMLFATETEYYEYLEENEHDEGRYSPDC